MGVAENCKVWGRVLFVDSRGVLESNLFVSVIESVNVFCGLKSKRLGVEF